MVADAVAVEPVSQVEFPANREINREFCQFCPDSQPALLGSRNDSAGLEWKFPTHSNREYFLRNKEFAASEQGKPERT